MAILLLQESLRTNTAKYEFKGNPYIYIRESYLDSDGEFLAGCRGISMRPDLLDNLKVLAAAMMDRVAPLEDLPAQLLY